MTRPGCAAASVPACLAHGQTLSRTSCSDRFDVPCSWGIHPPPLASSRRRTAHATRRFATSSASLSASEGRSVCLADASDRSGSSKRTRAHLCRLPACGRQPSQVRLGRESGLVRLLPPLLRGRSPSPARVPCAAVARGSGAGCPAGSGGAAAWPAGWASSASSSSSLPSESEPPGSSSSPSSPPSAGPSSVRDRLLCPVVAPISLRRRPRLAGRGRGGHARDAMRRQQLAPARHRQPHSCAACHSHRGLERCLRLRRGDELRVQLRRGRDGRGSATHPPP
mmetsp:Transcript_12839/g.32033  ORF Transcript_12839/g.32033 Transcript_12839/m.32033 type:complete len:281 (-) Transcript_12839:615-1457(-)